MNFSRVLPIGANSPCCLNESFQREILFCALQHLIELVACICQFLGGMLTKACNAMIMALWLFMCECNANAISREMQNDLSWVSFVSHSQVFVINDQYYIIRAQVHTPNEFHARSEIKHALESLKIKTKIKLTCDKHNMPPPIAIPSGFLPIIMVNVISKFEDFKFNPSNQCISYNMINDSLPI